jgi:hypothetical protein
VFSRKTILLLAGFIVLIFALGIADLFVLRFESGDVYPPYSSMRSDPLGTKVLYNSLADIDAVTAARNYLPLSRLGASRSTLLFLQGANASERIFWDPNIIRHLKTFLSNGGRLVVTFYPVRGETSGRSGRAADETPSRQTKQADPPSSPSASTTTRQKPSFWHDFGIDPEVASDPPCTRKSSGKDAAGKKSARARHATDVADLPDIITWHVNLYFKPLSNAWKTIYTYGGKPVVVERRFGSGSIALMADAYHLSNEALVNERHPGLIAWLMGKRTHVIFDESHFGITKGVGIANLAKKYHLQGLFLGILVLAGLFIWKNAVPLVPPEKARNASAFDPPASGEDYTQGLVSLLKRNIPESRILALCFDEFRKSRFCARRLEKDKTDRIESILDAQQPAGPNAQDPVKAYQAICRILSERK